MSKNAKSAAADPAPGKKQLSRKERKNLEYVKYAKQRKDEKANEPEEDKDWDFLKQQPADTMTKTAEPGEKKKKTKSKKKKGDTQAQPAATQEVSTLNQKYFEFLCYYKSFKWCSGNSLTNIYPLL